MFSHFLGTNFMCFCYYCPLDPCTLFAIFYGFKTEFWPHWRYGMDGAWLKTGPWMDSFWSACLWRLGTALACWPSATSDAPEEAEWPATEGPLMALEVQGGSAARSALTRMHFFILHPGRCTLPSSSSGFVNFGLGSKLQIWVVE